MVGEQEIGGKRKREKGESDISKASMKKRKKSPVKPAKDAVLALPQQQQQPHQSPPPQRRQTYMERMRQHRRKASAALQRQGDLQQDISESSPSAESGNPTQAVTNILALPTEILQHVFSFLPARTTVGLSFVCRSFKAVSEDDTFWRYTFKKKFGCARYLEMPWRQRFIFAERKARVIENYAVFGDRYYNERIRESAKRGEERRE